MPQVSPARVREIAQAIADDLNLSSQPWRGDYAFTARRTYWPNYQLADLDPASGGALRVDVLCGAQDWQAESRAQEEGDYSYAILIQQKVDRTDASAVQLLLDLVAAIADNWSLGKDLPRQWDATRIYGVGGFALIGSDTYRSMQADNIDNIPPTIAWEQVEPIWLREKHNPIIYSPREGDTKNSFLAEIDLVFRNDKGPVAAPSALPMLPATRPLAG